MYTYLFKECILFFNEKKSHCNISTCVKERTTTKMKREIKCSTNVLSGTIHMFDFSSLKHENVTCSLKQRRIVIQNKRLLRE